MKKNASKSGPSTAMAPDLDWSQVRETVRMLQLASAQINMALRDGDDSVDALTRSFTSMIGSVKAIAAAAEGLEQAERNTSVQRTIERNSAQVGGQMQAVIIAFQFYDKLSQRLAHVTHSLESLGELVGDKERLFNPCEWKALQEQIRSRYSMQEEQDMFDALLEGTSIDEALRLCESKKKNRDGRNDIELF